MSEDLSFHVVSGPVVAELLNARRRTVLDIVRQTYIQHDAGLSVCPDSYFLRFPEKPESRIIALPAFLDADGQMAGIKWISSFPGNAQAGLPRASALIILNDYKTGYPVACLEAATISSARTAASAALAAVTLRPGGFRGGRISVVGAGVIARNVCDYLKVAGCLPDAYLVYDLRKEAGQALVDYLRATQDCDVSLAGSLDEALETEAVIFATTTLAPYVTVPFQPGQLVLNLSLRDLAPEVILAAANVLDDIDHCLKANTSPHLAEQKTGSRDFVNGTLAQVLNREITLPDDRPVIFSPFGLGTLDLAVGSFVYRTARAAGSAMKVPDFFALAGQPGPTDPYGSDISMGADPPSGII